jgi:hypothetical protein
LSAIVIDASVSCNRPRATLPLGGKATYNGAMDLCPQDDQPLRCRRCRTELTPGRGDFYVVHVEAVADPSPPVFTDEDLARDPRAEIERLVEALADLSAQEAMDQVFRRLAFLLCASCYRQWIDNPVG